MATTSAFNTYISRETISTKSKDVDPNDQFPAINRTAPIRIISINGKDFVSEDIINNVCYVEVNERADGLSTATIKILNDKLKYTNDQIFNTQNIVQIWTGFTDTGIQKRGSFRINDVQYAFKGGKDLEIILDCVGPEWDLSFTEQRKDWTKIKDSEIAKQIAIAHNFDFAVQDTGTLVTAKQWNISDMKFLEKRARFYGYDVYVDEYPVDSGKPVLHFHEPFFPEPVLGPLYFSDGDRASLEYFVVTLDTWFRGVKYKATQFDPITKEYIDIESSEEEMNPLQKDLLKRVGDNHKTAKDYSSVLGEQPVRYLTNDGHIRNREEVIRQAQKFSEFSRYAISGCGKVIGLEQFKKRRVVRILGIGRLSGDYYITNATHIIDRTYDLKFSVIKISTDDFDSRRTEPRGLIYPQQNGLDFSNAINVKRDLKSNPPKILGTTPGPANFSRRNQQ